MHYSQMWTFFKAAGVTDVATVLPVGFSTRSKIALYLPFDGACSAAERGLSALVKISVGSSDGCFSTLGAGVCLRLSAGGRGFG